MQGRLQACWACWRRHIPACAEFLCLVKAQGLRASHVPQHVLFASLLFAAGQVASGAPVAGLTGAAPAAAGMTAVSRRPSACGELDAGQPIWQQGGCEGH